MTKTEILKWISAWDHHPYITGEKADLIADIALEMNAVIHAPGAAIDERVLHLACEMYGWGRSPDQIRESVKQDRGNTWKEEYDFWKHHDYDRYVYEIVGVNLYKHVKGFEIPAMWRWELSQEPYTGEWEFIQEDEYGGVVFL